MAETSGNHRIAAASRLMTVFLRTYARDKGDVAENPLELVEEVRPQLEKDQANNELATAWQIVGMVHGVGGRYSEATEAVEKSLHYARQAGNERLAAKAAKFLCGLALYGSTPVTDVIKQCEAAIQEGVGDRQIEAGLLCILATLRAMNGDLETARMLYKQGRDMLRDLGEGVRAAASCIYVAWVEMRGGDLAKAEREVRADFEFLERAGENYHLSGIAALLAQLIRDQGRDDEALPLLEMAEKLSAPNDVQSQATWRSVKAPILARKGDVEQAERVAREAVEMLGKTESAGLHADAMSELASVLEAIGRRQEALDANDAAIALYSRKGDVFGAKRRTEWVADIGHSA
jgi:tetratricopeptide (TPR) repeat protein